MVMINSHNKPEWTTSEVTLDCGRHISATDTPLARPDGLPLGPLLSYFQVWPGAAGPLAWCCWSPDLARLGWISGLWLPRPPWTSQILAASAQAAV